MKSLPKIDHVSRHSLTIIGVICVATGLILDFVVVDSNVPNDPNIGAGVLVLVGIGFLIASAAAAWSRRQRRQPPPPVAG